MGSSSEAEWIDGDAHHDEDARGSEQIARSSLEAFRAVAENSPDLILRFDQQHRHVYVNPAVEQRMRRQRHAIRGKTQRELGIDADVARLWEEQLERVFRSRRERRFEFALGSSWMDGREQFEAHAVPEIDRRGEVVTVLVVARDVTERRRAEAALEKREAALASAQRIAGCGSFQWELGSGALHCSDQLRRCLPLSTEPDPLSLADLLGLVHPEDWGRVRRTLEDAARGERTWSMQFRATDRDGVERILHSRGEVVTDDSGQPVRLLGTTLDVTEQEEVQRSVRQLLRFSQFAIEHAGDAILWIEPTGHIVSANRAASERFGRPSVELVGKPLSALGLTEPVGAWPERWRQLQATGRLGYEVTRAGDASLEIRGAPRRDRRTAVRLPVRAPGRGAPARRQRGAPARRAGGARARAGFAHATGDHRPVDRAARAQRGSGHAYPWPLHDRRVRPRAAAAARRDARRRRRLLADGAGRSSGRLGGADARPRGAAPIGRWGARDSRRGSAPRAPSSRLKGRAPARLSDGGSEPGRVRRGHRARA